MFGDGKHGFSCGPSQPAWMFLQARERVMHAMGQMGLMPKEAPKDVKVRRIHHLSITSYELSPSHKRFNFIALETI